MSLYTLYCERCQRRTTHDEVLGRKAEQEHVKEHPRYDTKVLCRDCKHGRSRADVPEEGLDVTLTAKLKVRGIDAHLDPDEIQEEESVYEYAQRIIKERHMDDVTELLAEEMVESGFIEREEGVWPRKS